MAELLTPLALGLHAKQEYDDDTRRCGVLAATPDGVPPDCSLRPGAETAGARNGGNEAKIVAVESDIEDDFQNTVSGTESHGATGWDLSRWSHWSHWSARRQGQ